MFIIFVSTEYENCLYFYIARLSNWLSSFEQGLLPKRTVTLFKVLNKSLK